MSDEIKAVAVIGAGTMGRGIAYVAALAGYRTSLFDSSVSVLDAARDWMRATSAKGVEKGKLDSQSAARAHSSLDLVDNLEDAVSSADLVIEAVPESKDVKVAVFQAIDTATPKHTIFASNTSALSITELAAATSRADRFAGMHFFNPVHLMRLIELVKGRETSEKTLSTLTSVGTRMGKEIVTVNEAPGFVTTRINALIGNEAFRMLESNVASASDIDTALKLGLNHPMGPFEMIDLVGLDVRLSILEHLHSTLGDLYRPSPLLVRYVDEGRLGRKTGRGVYRYDSAGRKID